MSGVLRAVETGRRIYQRMLTYTLNKIIKTLEIAVFLSVGVMLTGTFVITPLLVVLLLFTNDFVTMSIATDRVSFSPRSRPLGHSNAHADGRRARRTWSLVLSFAVFFVGSDVLHLPIRQLQTLVFLMLVFTGQGNVYLVRESNRLLEFSAQPLADDCLWAGCYSREPNGNDGHLDGGDSVASGGRPLRHCRTFSCRD